MSLINDALRKAKQAQQQTPESASPSLPLRPIEPSQPARRGLGLLVPAGSAIAALLLLFFLWQFSRGNSAKMVVAARADSPAHPAAVAPLASSPPAPAAQPEPPPAKLPPAATEPALAPSNPLTPATNGAAAGAGASASTNEPPGASTNESLAVAPAPPRPAPLRLQGIFLSSTRPSALVSGKTLFIGDRLGDFRLAALDQQTATLVSSDKTNVLTLGQ